MRVNGRSKVVVQIECAGGYAAAPPGDLASMVATTLLAFGSTRATDPSAWLSAHTRLLRRR